MLEILTLLILLHSIGNMARRRGRSPTLFALLLLGLWIGGEILGVVLAYQRLSPADARVGSFMLVVYAIGLVGAVIGGVAAFLIAWGIPPVEGVFRELPAAPPARSRIAGVLVGGIGGAVLGGLVVGYLYGISSGPDKVSMVIQAALVLATVGALLGLISGLQKE